MLKKRGKKELSTLIRVIRKSKNSKRERERAHNFVWEKMWIE